MRIEQLLCFYNVAKYKSFTQAANELYISQSAVSKMIASLERELNRSLFKRYNNGLVLTEFGKKVFEDTTVILDLVGGWQETTGNQFMEVHLLSSFTMCNFLAAIFLPLFQDSVPDILTLLHSCRSSEIIKNMDNFDYNIGIIPLRPENQEASVEIIQMIEVRGLCSQIIMRDRKVLYASAENELVQKNVIDKCDLKNYSLASYSNIYDENRAFFGKYFRDAVKYLRHSKSQILELVAEDKCMAIFPSITTQCEFLIKEGKIVELEVNDLDLGTVDFLLVHPPVRTLTSMERKVLSALKNFFAGYSYDNSSTS